MSDLINRIPSHQLIKMKKQHIVNEYDHAYNRAKDVEQKLLKAINILANESLGSIPKSKIQELIDKYSTGFQHPYHLIDDLKQLIGDSDE